MERRQCHGKQPPPPPTLAPPRRGHGERGSFSASLLDAIYRSLDEGGDGDGAEVARLMRLQSSEVIKTTAPPQFWWAKDGAKPKQAAGAGRSRHESTAPLARPRHSGYASSTTSSSDASSSYSFSCSSASTTDTESTRRRRHSQSPPQQPEEVDADVAAPPPPKSKPKKKKKSRPCFPGARLRPRSAVPPPSSGSPPTSPATFACVVKALFTSSRLPRQPKTPTAIPPPPSSPPVPQPKCTSVTTSITKEPERRSVRFCPDAETTTTVVRRRVEELVRTLADVEEDEDGSDSSSDLFELESLRGADGDELPVYGTTSLTTNRAIAHGAVC